MPCTGCSAGALLGWLSWAPLMPANLLAAQELHLSRLSGLEVPILAALAFNLPRCRPPSCKSSRCPGQPPSGAARGARYTCETHSITPYCFCSA